MPRKTAKHKIIVTTERVIQTRNEIHVSDEELAALRACGGALNKDVLTILERNKKGKHLHTRTIHRASFTGSDNTPLVKWSTEGLQEGAQ